MRETNRTTSIARRISLDNWVQTLKRIILLNVVIGLLAVATFAYSSERALSGGQTVTDRHPYRTSSSIGYTFTTKTGQNYNVSFYDLWFICKTPGIILLSFEGILLIDALFQTSRVRRRMGALNDIALKTTELGNMEEAITKLNPGKPDAKLYTGDPELSNLETAINNLLARMRESHKQQDRFVSDASHELRTPISVIQGYVNMLDRWGKDDEQVLDEAIEALKNESEHMKNLVEQLLFLARGDSGRNTLHFADFDLVTTMKDVAEESEMIDDEHVYAFTSKWPSARVTTPSEGPDTKKTDAVSLEKPGPVSLAKEAKTAGDSKIILHGDVAMIKQSARILVQNAAKYSEKGTTITISVFEEAGHPCFSIQDEGIGIAPEDTARVFQRFFRTDNARNSNEGGTGLGLSIAKWITDAHQGEITVLSRPEFGTRFTIKY